MAPWEEGFGARALCGSRGRGGVFDAIDSSAKHSSYVDIEHHAALSEGEGQNSRCGVVPNAGQPPQFLVGVWNLAREFGHDRPCGRMKADSSTRVSQAPPGS
jgi:hypothetical protein